MPGYSREEITEYLERHPQISYNMLSKERKAAVRQYWSSLEEAKVRLGLKHPIETRYRSKQR